MNTLDFGADTACITRVFTKNGQKKLSPNIFTLMMLVTLNMQKQYSEILMNQSI